MGDENELLEGVEPVEEFDLFDDVFPDPRLQDKEEEEEEENQEEEPPSAKDDEEEEETSDDATDDEDAEEEEESDDNKSEDEDADSDDADDDEDADNAADDAEDDASAPDPRDAQIAALQGQVEALTAIVAAGQQKPSDSPDAKSGDGKSKEQNKDKENERHFNMGVPDQILEAIISQEPDNVKAGLNTLINGVAEVVRTQVMKEFDAGLDNRLNNYTQERQGAESQKKEVENAITAYFTEYPGHVGLEPVVQAALVSLVDANPTIREWTPEVRRQLAEQVAAWTGNSGKRAARKAEENNPAPSKDDKKDTRKGKDSKKKRPPRMTRPGSRAASSPKSTEQSIEDQIKELESLQL